MADQFYDDGDEHDHDHAQAMIDWLADKNPDVWFDVTRHLNWDSSSRVLDWIVSQPQCDRANAAAVFWGCDPLYYVKAYGSDTAATAGGLALLERVLRNWKIGFYRRAELAWDEDWRERYRRVVAARPGHRDPFAIPKDLLGPIPGRAPEIPAELRANNNAELKQLLWNLGTDVQSGAHDGRGGKAGSSFVQRMRSAFGLG